MPSHEDEEVEKYHGIFIRAPGIVSINNNKDVKVLATLPSVSSGIENRLCNGSNNGKGKLN